MKKIYPVMYDCPERSTSLAGLAYGVLCFYSFPFLMLFFSQGFRDATSQSWFEIFYHVCNFLVVLRIFHEYLKDSFFNVHSNLESFLTVTSVCAVLMILYASIIWFLGNFTASYTLNFASYGTLPLVEMELFNLTSNLVWVNPIVGTVCVVFLTPVTTSCLYYATTFAPICNSRPWLAYIALAVIVAIPRICNAITFWPPSEELILYLAQLPLHLIACAAYQKTDTIWAPIAVHMAANILSCVGVFVLFGILWQ